MPESKSRRRGGKTRRKPNRLRIIKIAAAMLAVPTLVAAIFLIRYYYIFDGIIEQKLGKNSSVSETEIYAAPSVLHPGKRISLEELQAKLRRLGYEPLGADQITAVSSYSPGKSGRLIIHNDASILEDGDRTMDVELSNNSIRSIIDIKSQAELESVRLKPEMVSNAIGQSREKRRFVLYQDLPPVLINAVLAAEDRRFFSHSGIDPIRILMALLIDLREGEKVQGASTLTQQFVKNYFLTPERTWRRKFTDAYMSILLERRLSKEQIFELYANEVYLGQIGSFGIVGFGEAANAFFDKGVKDLTLAEAATLAGVITAPNRYTPLRYPDRATARRNLVIDQMAEFGMIQTKERNEAKAAPLEVRPSSILNYSDAPYFVDYVQDLLVESYGNAAVAQLKYKVYTALDMDLQKAAFEALRNGMVELDDYFSKPARGSVPSGTVQASLIAVDPRNGHILAMVGGRNYGTSQFNRITQSKRQPGSIFKPFVYAAALETSYYSSTPLTVVSTVLDEPTQFTFEDLLYEPGNFKDEYYGQVTMRQAITKSLNVATIRFAEKVGYSRIAELARRLRLNALIKPYPAMAIGAFEVTPLEMVRAYTAFANGGLLSDLTPILKVYDGESNPVFVAQPKTDQALTPQIAFMVTSLLQSVMNRGTGAGVRTRGFSLPAAGKTGTSRDGWFAGYTPDMLCIVWVGFDDNRELNLSGAQAALPIWAEFMKKATYLRPLSGAEFPLPDGVPEVEIDPTTGLLATNRCLEKEIEYFIKGTEPVVYCYGNNYEEASSGAPSSIYATPVRETAIEVERRGTAAEGSKTAR
jgi:penicillin-binding protein 1B